MNIGLFGEFWFQVASGVTATVIAAYLVRGLGLEKWGGDKSNQSPHQRAPSSTAPYRDGHKNPPPTNEIPWGEVLKVLNGEVPVGGARRTTQEIRPQQPRQNKAVEVKQPPSPSKSYAHLFHARPQPEVPRELSFLGALRGGALFLPEWLTPSSAFWEKVYREFGMPGVWVVVGGFNALTVISYLAMVLFCAFCVTFVSDLIGSIF